MSGLCLIGVITGVHGIRGTVTVLSYSDIPGRFERLKLVRVGATPESTRSLEVHSVDEHKNRILLTFEEIPDRTQAEKLKGLNLYVTEEEMAEAPEGRYFIHDLIGCEVVTVQGERKGSVRDVMLLPANDVYVVDCDGREVLIPAVPSIVTSVNIAARVITVEPMPGLFEENDED
ncbi:MAG: ribosome maturation factor RimM [Bacteroidia bacterium]|nr:ribosome maturation factor RimM [Bacteroidia bacterium]